MFCKWFISRLDIVLTKNLGGNASEIDKLISRSCSEDKLKFENKKRHNNSCHGDAST